MKRSRRSAFTLVELMIIVAIMADIMVIALPAFLRARNQAQNARFITDLRTAAAAFEMYAAENNKYPAGTAAGVVPSGMTQYLGGFPWSSGNAISTSWTWAPSYQSCTATIRLTSASALDDLRMQDIDQRMDNGILATGAFRKADVSNYYYIIEQ
jgi:type II secretory pathway pseudopilin PulG